MPTDSIMVIRHAQKPSDQPEPRAGVREDGRPDPESLSVLGWQRAGALAAVFGGRREHLADLGLLRPDAIFASGRTARKPAGGSDHEKIGSHSRRPVETVTPTARRLGLTPVEDYLRGQEAALIEDAKSRGGVVLICWQHEQIPLIGELILGKAGVVPAQWADDCYSEIWIFQREANGWSFQSRSLPLIETR